MDEEENQEDTDSESPTRVRVPPWEVGQRVQLIPELRASNFVGHFGTVIECEHRPEGGVFPNSPNEWVVHVQWHPSKGRIHYTPSSLVHYLSPISKTDEARLITLNSRYGYKVTDRELTSLRQEGLIEVDTRNNGQRVVRLTKEAKQLAVLFKAESGVLRALKAAVRPAVTRDGIRKDLESYIKHLKRPGLDRGQQTGAVWRDSVVEALKAIADGTYDPKEYEDDND